MMGRICDVRFTHKSGHQAFMSTSPSTKRGDERSVNDRSDGIAARHLRDVDFIAPFRFLQAVSDAFAQHMLCICMTSL
jgi:hypothetical protein